MTDIPGIMKVMGPPGTGKTTYLIRALARATKRFDPAGICAVSYTKAATEEIKARASKHADIDLMTSDNIRTIHAICFRLLNMTSDKVADEKIVEWNLDHPEMTISTKIEYSEESVSEAFDSKYLQGRDAMQNWMAFQRMQVFRKKMVPVKKWYDYQAERLYAE
jgi:Superfamily I DNA and RNA helicases